MELANLQNQINSLKENQYPIGSIYMSVKDENPGSKIEGTWVSWGSGKVPVGVDINQSEFNSVEKMGGEKNHLLTISEMPSHNHSLYKYHVQYGDITPADNVAGWFDHNQGSGGATLNTGGNQPHNNLQPYITCYMWKRIA